MSLVCFVRSVFVWHMKLVKGKNYRRYKLSRFTLVSREKFNLAFICLRRLLTVSMENKDISLNIMYLLSKIIATVYICITYNIYKVKK